MIVQFASFEWTLESTSDLVGAMQASLAQAGYHGGKPLVVVGRDVSVPAWEFVVDLARKDALWRSSCGVALQHAVSNGGDLEQTAFADLLANYRASMLLLDWTVPLAARFPNARATRAHTGMGGGAQDPTVAAVIAEQQALFPLITSPDREAVLAGDKLVAVPDAAALAALLDQTAAQGRPVEHGFGTGPWGWLHEEVFLRDWVVGALVSYVERVFAGRDIAPVAAALDWLSDGHRLEAFVDVLRKAATAAPSWVTEAARTKPPRWTRPIRPATWSGVATYGDVLIRLTTAATNAATPPREDLARLF